MGALDLADDLTQGCMVPEDTMGEVDTAVSPLGHLVRSQHICGMVLFVCLFVLILILPCFTCVSSILGQL